MPTVIDSLLVSLGWKVDPKGLEGYAALTQRVKMGALGVGAAVSGAFLGVEKLVHGAAERMGGIQKFSEQMNISARTVAALGKVASENDSSLEGMESGLRQMTIMAGQAEKGIGRGAMVFKKFGLSAKDAKKPVEELLGKVAEKLSKASPNERQFLGARLGFDPAMILLLSKGRANFEKLRDEALRDMPFTAADYKAADLAEKGFKKAAAAATLLRDRIAIKLLPAVNQMLAQFVAWTKNPEKIRTLERYMRDVVNAAKWVAAHFGTILKIVAAVTALKAAKWVAGLGKELWDTGKAVLGLVRGFGILRATLMTGILGLFVLLAEDLWTFHEGGLSVTGWLVDKFPEAVDRVQDALAVLGAAFVAVWAQNIPAGIMALAIYEIVKAGEDLKESWSAIQDWWDDLWDDIGNTAAKVVNPIIKAMHFLGLAGETAEIATGNVNRDFRYKQRMIDDWATGAEGKRRASAAARAGEKDTAIPWLGHGGEHRFGAMGAFWGRHAGGNVHNETHVGAVHVHVKGGEKMTSADWKKGVQEMKRQMELEGLMTGGGKDANRVAAMNAAGAE